MLGLGYNIFNYCVRIRHGDCLSELWNAFELFEYCAVKNFTRQGQGHPMRSGAAENAYLPLSVLFSAEDQMALVF